VAEIVTRRFLADVAAGCIIGGYVGKYRDIANGRMVTALVETAMAAGLVQPAAGRGQPALLTDPRPHRPPGPHPAGTRSHSPTACPTWSPPR
jgi:hypothetical protein